MKRRKTMEENECCEAYTLPQFPKTCEEYVMRQLQEIQNAYTKLMADDALLKKVLLGLEPKLRDTKTINSVYPHVQVVSYRKILSKDELTRLALILGLKIEEKTDGR